VTADEVSSQCYAAQKAQSSLTLVPSAPEPLVARRNRDLFSNQADDGCALRGLPPCKIGLMLRLLRLRFVNSFALAATCSRKT